MDEQEIRKVIAEFDGFIEPQAREDVHGLAAFMGRRSPDGPLVYVPDYEVDLNQMHRIEAELERRGLAEDFVGALVKLMEHPCEKYDGLPLVSVPELVMAPASQRARAAYEVITQHEALSAAPNQQEQS